MEPFDLVLVDGRFRAACFLEVVRHYVVHQWRSPTILIHDYMNRILPGWNGNHSKPWYNDTVLQKYAKRFQNADTLAAFYIQPSTYNNSKLMADLEKDISDVKYIASRL